MDKCSKDEIEELLDQIKKSQEEMDARTKEFREELDGVLTKKELDELFPDISPSEEKTVEFSAVVRFRTKEQSRDFQSLLSYRLTAKGFDKIMETAEGLENSNDECMIYRLVMDNSMYNCDSFGLIEIDDDDNTEKSYYQIVTYCGDNDSEAKEDVLCAISNVFFYMKNSETKHQAHTFFYYYEHNKETKTGIREYYENFELKEQKTFTTDEKSVWSVLTEAERQNLPFSE